MKYAVTYNVGKIPFRFVSDNVHKIYEAVCEIIDTNKLMYPDQDKAKNNFFLVCANIAAGEMLSHENFMFRVERIDDTNN